MSQDCTLTPIFDVLHLNIYHSPMRLFALLLFTIPSFAQEFKLYEQEIPGTGVVFKMAPVKGGTFTMGTPVSEYGREQDEQEHQVDVSAFWMGVRS